MEENSWKETKELFVSGLNGTTLSEITTIIGSLPLIYLFRVFPLCWCPVLILQNQFSRFILDFFTLIVPVILIVTKLSSCLIIFVTLLIGFEISMFIVILTEKTKHDKETKPDCFKPKKSFTDLDELSINKNTEKTKKTVINQISLSELKFVNVLSKNLPFLKWFRSIISIVTCICILAVDFQVFPRRLAKTELFGSGLMDVGVGFYVISNALVCRESRIGQTRANIPTKYKHNTLHFSALLFQIISTWPIVLLGLIRLISVKSLGYQEHISEYGVHWNFFFTLAAVKNLASVVLFFMNSKYSWLASIIIALFYQSVLSSHYFDATAILINANREGFLMQNKEGLASCIGFLSLYFAGVHLGSFLFKPRNNLHKWLVASLKLFAASVLLWCLLYVCESQVQQISRRLANLSYVLWLLAQTSFLISLAIALDVIAYWYIFKSSLPPYAKADKWLVSSQIKSSETQLLTPPSPELCLLCAVSRNQLLYFLISNLMTGLVNSLINTMNVNDAISIAILFLYQFVVLLFVWYLHMKQITFKFW